MKTYKINANTLMIIPYKEKYSLIIEKDKDFIIETRPNNIIKKNCVIYGSNFNGRLKSTELLTGYTYKAPILLKEEGNLIFFPTSSPRLSSCSWINFNNIDDTYYDKKKRVSIVIFTCGKSMEINTSLNIINNQIFRATRLDHNIRKNVVLKV